MWYFTWILGVLLALAFGIINVMWYEAEQCMDAVPDDDDERDDAPPES
jgi:cyd operon protein YbgT